LTFCTLVLTTIGAMAAWLPARQAARIDPAQVLREGWTSTVAELSSAQKRWM
jgi:hypothetical protein